MYQICIFLSKEINVYLPMIFFFYMLVTPGSPFQPNALTSIVVVCLAAMTLSYVGLVYAECAGDIISQAHEQNSKGKEIIHK